MNTMQEFYSWLSSVGSERPALKGRLAGLRRLTISRIQSLAAFEPWWIWGAEASPMEA